MLQTSLSLEQIQKYSYCPRKYGYSIGGPKPKSDFIRSSVKTIIKQAYVNRSKQGYNPQWDTIKSRINKLAFEDVDINDKEAFQAAYKRSLSLLTICHSWYYKLFSNESLEGLANIPLSVLISKTNVVANLDVALLDPKYSLVPIIFNDQDILPTMLYNNIQFKSLLWLIYKETNIYPKLSYYYVINEQSVIRHEVWNKTPASTIEKYLNFIVRGIENKIFYPSVSEACTVCEFESICTI